jgi:hypothetical protein
VARSMSRYSIGDSRSMWDVSGNSARYDSWCSSMMKTRPLDPLFGHPGRRVGSVGKNSRSCFSGMTLRMMVLGVDLSR